MSSNYPQEGETAPYPHHPTPSYQYVICPNPKGYHKISYLEWGPNDANKVVFCVHGLTGDATNFEYLASYLADKHGIRTVSVDVLGRGNSDRLEDTSLYCLQQYANDVMVVFARVSADGNHFLADDDLRTGPQATPSPKQQKEYYYLGNSMGGMIGMHISCDKASPFKAVILNDIGPAIPIASIARIATYVKASDKEFFPSLTEAAAYTLKIYGSFFGPYVDHDYFFRRCTYACRRRNATDTVPADNAAEAKENDVDGYVLNYHRLGTVAGLLNSSSADKQWTAEEICDPSSTEFLSFWNKFEKITKPLLVYQGENSDLLTPAILDQMEKRYIGPKMSVVRFEKTGHLPPLYVEREFLPIVKFIMEN